VINTFTMLATRQVLGNVARSRVLAGAASGIRRLATVSDSPLDKKVSKILLSAARVLRERLDAWRFFWCGMQAAHPGTSQTSLRADRPGPSNHQ
jgi:hypothetical protein